MLKNKVLFYSQEIKNVANKGFFHLFTSQGLMLVAGFLSQFFVAGFLDPTDIGRIKIMQTYINLTALICGLGFDTSLLKLASEDRSEVETKKLYQTAFLVALLSFIFIYFSLYLLSVSGLVSSDPVITRIFPVYTFFLLPLCLQNIQMAYYQARKKIKKMAELQVITKGISLLFIVVFTYFFKLDGYVATVILTGVLGIILFELGIRNMSTHVKYFRLELKLLRTMWSLARFALITNILGMITTTIDVYLINYLVPDRKEVGYYMFALTVLSIYQLLPLTIQRVAFPYFSQQSSSYEKWFSSYVKYNKLNHILAFLAVIAGILVLPVLIKFAFSGKYDRSIYYFVFLSFAWMIKGSNIMKGTAIMGYGRFDINFLASLITLVLTFPIVYFLIKHYGLNGAVAGMITGSVISYITFSLFFRRFNKTLMNGL